MIINGGARGSVSYWSGHLTNTAENERAEVIEVSGVLASDLPGALQEMEAIAGQSRCRGNFMYQANINPERGEVLTPDQWQQAVDTLEKNLHLEGHQRIVVEHEKDGRTHRHVIWNRVDVETLRVTDIGGNYYTHERTQEQLSKEFGLNQTPTLHGNTREEGRPERAPEVWEKRAAERSGISPDEIKAELTALWRATDNGKAFAAGLEEKGFILANGDRRGFVILDQAGTVHSLARRLDGVNTRQVNERLSDIDRTTLPTVSEAKTTQAERETEREGRPSEPILEASSIRMYRGMGNNVGSVSPGEAVFFSTDPKRAASFGELHYVDITAAELAKFEQPHSGGASRTANDWRTGDPDIIGRLKPLLTERAVAPALDLAAGLPTVEDARTTQRSRETLSREEPAPAPAQVNTADLSRSGEAGPEVTPEELFSRWQTWIASQNAVEAREHLERVAASADMPFSQLTPAELFSKWQAQVAMENAVEDNKHLERVAAKADALASPLTLEGFFIRWQTWVAKENAIEARQHLEGVAAGADAPASESAARESSEIKWEFRAEGDDQAAWKRSGGSEANQVNTQKLWRDYRDAHVERVTAPPSSLEHSAEQAAFKVAGFAGGLADFVSSLFSGGTPSVRKTPDQVEQIISQRRALVALERLHDSMDRGEAFQPSDIRSLTPTHLEQLRLFGDGYMRKLLESFDYQRRALEQENEPGWRREL